MKMRFDSECRKCRRRLPFGTQALHMFGGYWHLECYKAYREKREAAIIRRPSGEGTRTR